MTESFGKGFTAGKTQGRTFALRRQQMERHVGTHETR